MVVKRVGRQDYLKLKDRNATQAAVLTSSIYPWPNLQPCLIVLNLDHLQQQQKISIYDTLSSQFLQKALGILCIETSIVLRAKMPQIEVGLL